MDRKMMSPAEVALMNAFRSHYSELPFLHRCALTTDLGDLAVELAKANGNEDSLEYGAAAVELRRRIGGPVNLASYAKCLMVGTRRSMI